MSFYNQRLQSEGAKISRVFVYWLFKSVKFPILEMTTTRKKHGGPMIPPIRKNVMTPEHGSFFTLEDRFQLVNRIRK